MERLPKAGTGAGFPETACQNKMGPMANELPNGNGAGAEAAPSLNALIQYTKDFSFENPKAPRSLAQQGPQMSLQVNVGSTALGDNDYETVLRLEGKAEIKGETLFAFDLSYAGVFRLQNIPQEHVHPVLVIDCARLLFPFARQIIAEAVQNGGFPLLRAPDRLRPALPAAHAGARGPAGRGDQLIARRHRQKTTEGPLTGPFLVYCGLLLPLRRTGPLSMCPRQRRTPRQGRPPFPYPMENRWTTL